MKSRKKKNNNTGLIICAVVVVILIASALLQGIISDGSKKSGNGNFNANGSNSEASGDWEKALASDDIQLIYLGRPTCSWCNKIRPELNYLVEEYDVNTTYINMDDINATNQTLIFNKLDIDSSNFGTPYLAVIKNGKKIAEQVGFIEEQPLFNFLKQNGLIKSDATYVANPNPTEGEGTATDDSSYKNIKFLNYSEYKAIYESGEKSVIVLGQTGCSYCNNYKPILNTIAKEEGVKISYLDMRTLSEEEWNSVISNHNDYFKDHEQWGTPLTFIVENKKVVDSLSGAQSESDTIDFYKDNKIIK